MRAGVIDLWAVNLIAAIISNADKDQSQINCAVGRWTVKDGLLTSEFFNLATPLRVRGDFADIDLGVKRGSLLFTALDFITSPIHVPVRRVVSENIPRNGEDACSVTLGPDNHTEITVSGCK